MCQADSFRLFLLAAVLFLLMHKNGGCGWFVKCDVQMPGGKCEDQTKISGQRKMYGLMLLCCLWHQSLSPCLNEFSIAKNMEFTTTEEMELAQAKHVIYP